MKARRQALTLVFAAFFALALTGAYLHFGLFPGSLRDYVVEKIESLSGRRVAFEKSVYLPFKGLIFYDLRVTDPGGSVLFSAKKVSINAKLWTFILDQKIVITEVSLDTPVYDLGLNGLRPPPPPAPKTKISGQIDVPTLPPDGQVDLQALQYGPEALLPENVYLERIQIIDGILIVRSRPSDPATEIIHGIQLRMGFEKPPVLRFDGSLKLGKKTYGRVELNGRWDLDRAAYEFKLKIDSERIPSWLAEYQKKSFIRVQEGRVAVDATVRSISERSVLFRADADLSDASISAQGARYTGQMAAEAEGVFDFDRRSFDRYRGTLHFVDVKAEHFSKTFDTLDGVSGKINFQPDLLEINAIRGQYHGTVFEADGTIRSFKDLILDAKIGIDSNVAAILRLLPAEKLEAVKGYSLDGVCRAVTHLKGSLKNPQNLAATHHLALSGGSVVNEARHIDFEDVSGAFEVDRTSLRIADGRFQTAGKKYAVSGTIPFLPEAPGSLELRTEGMSVAANYTSKKGAVSISKGRFSLPGVEGSFHGEIGDLATSRIEARGQATVALEKAAALLGPNAKAVRDSKLRGTLRGPFILKGAWNKPLDWDLQFDGKSAGIYAKEKLELDDFQIQVRMKNRVVNVPYLHASPYGGSFGGKMAFDLGGPVPAFNGKIYANGVNLERLAPALDPKQKDLAGTLIFDATLSGILGRQETFTGQGMIDVRNGRLWKTDLFKKMGELPFVKVEGLNEVLFTSANATFVVADKKISTGDLNLLSDTVDLKFDGDVGFDGALDLTMLIRYSNDVIRGGVETGGIVPFMLQQAEQMISEYKIAGTLAKPKFEKSLMPSVSKVGKKVGGLVQSLSI